MLIIMPHLNKAVYISFCINAGFLQMSFVFCDLQGIFNQTLSIHKVDGSHFH